MEERERAQFPGTDRVDPRVLHGPGYTSTPPRNDPFAIAAIVLGVGAVIPFVGILAIICGHVALHRLRDPYRAGRGLAVAGLVLGYTLSALWLLVWLAPRAA